MQMKNAQYAKVVLIEASPIWLTIVALRKCWSSEAKSDSFFTIPDSFSGVYKKRSIYEHIAWDIDDQFVMGASDKRLLLKALEVGHTSTLEHVKFTFDLSNISRGLLQELARHRIASLSVQSSRYTLKRLLNNEAYAGSLLVPSGDEDLDKLNAEHMMKLAALGKHKGLSNDVLKYGIVEAYKTTLLWTINIRSLHNFMKLRTSSGAHFEIKGLAAAVYDVLPADYKMFYSEFYQEAK